MSSSSSGYGSVSWTYAAAGILAGVGAGYALGIASSRWMVAEGARPRGGSGPGAAGVSAKASSGTASTTNLVTAVVELTAEV